MYIITYRQFKRGRRSNHKLPMQANSIQDARIKFLKAINLAQKLQKYHPFNCNHVHIISIFEEGESWVEKRDVGASGANGRSKGAWSTPTWGA